MRSPEKTNPGPAAPQRSLGDGEMRDLLNFARRKTYAALERGDVSPQGVLTLLNMENNGIPGTVRAEMRAMAMDFMAGIPNAYTFAGMGGSCGEITRHASRKNSGSGAHILDRSR